MPTLIQKISPFLWFDGKAEDAANFYTSVFPDSRITQIMRAPEGVPGPRGSVMLVTLELCGQKFFALNGGPGFPFTQAISLVVNCDTQAEIDRYWDKLTSGGGSPIQCGWLKDRFGLCWQIVPSNLGQLMSDPAKTARVMKVVMQSIKLDMGAMQAAAEGR